MTVRATADNFVASGIALAFLWVETNLIAGVVPMGELFVEEGTIPGDDPHHLSGADGTIWHPSGRWAATVVRLCGGTVILDAENNFEPVAFLQFNKDAPNQYPVTKIDNDHWQVTFDKIFSRFFAR